ncbi:MAG: translation initiation factor IF-2 N-terminal domain-containing protein, partial [Solirubrobacterales bacterium]
MAKKRVHEIAKQQGLTSKEVLAALNAAGVEATAAASSVEEEVALKALSSGKRSAAGDGAKAAPEAKPAKAAAGEGGEASSPAKAKSARAVQAAGGRPGARPGGKRRRVVIDSQASRREHMPQA